MAMQTLTTIDIPDAPSEPGLVFRRFNREADLPAMVEVINACFAADHLNDLVTLEDLANQFAHPVNYDPYHDAVFVERGGALVALGWTTWRRDDDGLYLYFQRGYVLPEWRGRGIGRAILGFTERRAREIDAVASRPDGAPRFYSAFAADTETARHDLLARAGYAPVRHFFEMGRPTLEDIPVWPVPAGLELRAVEPQHYRPIFDALVEAFRDHWSNVSPTEEDYQAWLHRPTFDPSLWCIAWDGDEVAGVSVNDINPEHNAHFGRLEGWVDDLAVRRPWRGRGLGHALLVASLHAFKARGMTSAGLGVDSENLSGALRLYESVGFRPVKRFASYRKPLE